MGLIDSLFLTLQIPDADRVKMNSTEPHCGQGWKTFQDDFRNNAFAPIMLSLYSFGVIFNSLSIAIFAKNKISSSNVLFMSLAISDLTVSILGVPFSWYFLMPAASGSASASGSQSKTKSLVGHYYLILLRLFYNISVLHTTTLAVWRFIAVTYPLKERTWCRLRNTIIAIVVLYGFCILYEVKSLLCYTNVADIVFLKNNNTASSTAADGTATSNATSQRISSTQIGTDGFLCTFPEYIYVAVVRILPSIIIIICSFRLIYVLQSSKKRRKELMPNLQTDLAKDADKEKQMNRTTRMLLGIMILFLLDKVAGAVIKILIIFYDINFIHDCLPAFVQIISILSLIYVSSPFVVYYVSSQQFRVGFKSLFRTEKCYIWSDDEVSVQMNTESTHF